MGSFSTLADHGVVPVMAIATALPLVDARVNWKTIARNAAKAVAPVRKVRDR